MVVKVKLIALALVALVLAGCGHGVQEVRATSAAPPTTVEVRRDDPPPPSPTTTTTVAPATTTTRPPRTPVTAPPAPPTTEAPLRASAAIRASRTWSSTNYCLRGTMANGRPVHDGAVAVNDADWSTYRGTSWTVTEGAFSGRTFTVEDHGPGADFDIWVPSCAAARQYGRHTIQANLVE